jgi:hypothetical protein
MLTISPLSIASNLPAQVTGTTPPAFAKLLRRVQAVAERIENDIYELDARLDEFRNTPDEIWDAVANVSAVLEFATCDIQGAMEDLHAAVHAA